MKPLVIFHKDCADGFGAAFAAWMKFGDEAEYVALNYNERDSFMNTNKVSGRDVYVLDFSFSQDDTTLLIQQANSLVFLDHHKTAFEEHAGAERNIYLEEATNEDTGQQYYILLDNNKSGALLAWEYFHPNTSVPYLIQLIDDRDRWVFNYPDTKEVHAGLMLRTPWNFENWREYITFEQLELDALKNEGAICLAYFNQQIRMIKSSCTETINIQDFPSGLCCNAHGIFASELGNLLAKESGTYGATWYQAGNGDVHWSLRSIGDFDVSEIAKKFGGGGHKNAAGFVLVAPEKYAANGDTLPKGIRLWHTM